MYSFSNVRSVAKYESILLRRSWFYRIFLVLAVLFFVIFNYGNLIDSNNNWVMRALASNIPYINLLLLNAGQAVIAVFLSSEFLKADKKLDTSEVFYVHPLSNAEYVFGKIWGNLNVFIQLNLIIIALVLVFNFIAGIPVDWLAYLIYFLIISIPTLVYIFGLSIGMMLIIKNQAITFVILLGYIALSLFYVGDKFYYLFDYMAYSLPLMKSSIVGFGNWSVLIGHRMIYMLIGLGFICVSIFLFRRLPNTKYGRYRWLALAFVFIFGGMAAGYRHVDTFLSASRMRALYTEINNKHVHSPQMLIDHYDIKVEQHPRMISATVSMQGMAQETSSVFVFCLNPSLKISGIRENGKELSHKREHQIVLIDFGRVLEKGDSTTLEISYSGRIDENFCYLDIPTELLNEKSTADNFFNIDKRYSFQTDNYVLFTPETYWYPRPGVSYSSESPDWQKSYFSNYRLEVKTINGLQALSQGTRLQPAEKVPAMRSNEFDPNDGVAPRFSGPVRMTGGGGGPMGGRGGQRGGGGNFAAQPVQGAQGGNQIAVQRQGGGENDQRQGDQRQVGQGEQRQVGQGGDQRQGRTRTQDGQEGQDGAQRRGGERMSPAARDSLMALRREGGEISPAMRDSLMARRREGGERPSPAMRDSMMARSREGGERASPAMRDSMMARRREGGERVASETRDSATVRRRDGGDMMAQGGQERRQGGDSIARFRRGDDSASIARDELAAATIEMPLDSIFIFETDFPTPGISLIIGNYEQEAIEVDHTVYSIWHLKGNDHFTAVFDTISDTIAHQLRMRRHGLETMYSLNYSFKRFSIVEVPVQFSTYVRAWTQAQETMQPEMVLYPEKGALFHNMDVARQVRSQKEWAKRQGREMSEVAAALAVFNNFLMTFQRAENRGDFSTERGAVNVSSVPNPYFIFPQLFKFRYNVYSSEWPVANRLIELYLQEFSDNMWMRQMNGISNNEKANILIQQRPFKELLSDPEHRDLLNNIISQKANVLFAPAERNMGNVEFRDSLRSFLNQNKFSNIGFERLLEEMSLLSEEDLIAPLATWNAPANLPVYLVGTPQITNIVNRDQEVYVVRLRITNDSDYDGIINVETLFGGGGGGGGPARGGGGNFFFTSGGSDDPRAKRKISFAARETKEIVTVWDRAPRAIAVNTLISGNLPNLINIPLSNIARERNMPIDEEGDFILAHVNHHSPGEVIVDNEDAALFELSQPDMVGLLPKWLDAMGDDSFPYSGVTQWRPPLQWTLTTNDKYFGTHIRSAYVIKSGNGSQTATWKVPVPSRGLYDLYYHVFVPDEVRNQRNTRGRGGGGGGSSAMEYHFTVKYDDGEDNAYVNLRRAEEGWNRVGSFYFSDDTVRVVLSNRIANVRMVTADAVKIVKRETSAVGELRGGN